MSVKEDIKKGEFKSIYLLCGEEDYLRDIYKNDIIKKVLDPGLKDFNYKEFTSKKPLPEEMDDFISCYPCMSEKKILYIKNSGIFKSANEAEKKYWQNIFEEVPDFVIIIFSETEIDKRGVLYKSISKLHSVDEFPHQKEADLVNWIGRHCAAGKKEISADTAKHLIECCSSDMYLLKSEIDKLISYVKSSKITNEDIDVCCCKVAESRVFDMIDDFLSGKIAQARIKYDELKRLKEEPIAINGAIFSKYNQLRKEKILSKTMTPREIAAKLGQREFFVNLHLRQTANIPIEALDKVVNLCSDADHKIKSGLIEPWAAIDIIIANMV